MPNIILKNVSKKFGNVQALRDINLEIKDKEILCVLGPTAAGKTTLLRTLVGLESPDSGLITIDGMEITNLSPEERGTVYLPQTYSLFVHLNVWENAVFGPKVMGWPKKEWTEVGKETLQMVGLLSRAESYPKELSGGMQQRCALARALATDSDIFLFDEPLRALDARLRIELRTELRKLIKDLEKTVVWVTHDQEEAITVSDRLLVLNKGAIQQVGSPLELYQKPGHPFVAEFLGESNIFEGTVIKTNTGNIKISIIESENFKLEARNFNDLQEGDKCKVFIKLEDSFPSQSSKDPNLVKGTIKRINFLGKYVKLEMTGDLHSVATRIPSSALGNYREGDEMSLSLKSDRIHVFPEET